MFNPNDNRDRRDYGSLLMPPEGYILEKAVGTTYSLDLEALTAVSICMGLLEDTDSKIMQNPVAMLHALQKVSDRILIFCEAGQIKMPSKQNRLSILLEKMIVEMALPKERRTGRYPAFHPKTWTLCYVNPKGNRKYRFIIMSRNLTFDRSWDISFAMDSSDKVRQKRKTTPIIDFLEYLKGNIHNTTINAGKKRMMLSELMADLKGVSFSLDSKAFGEEFQILPLGIGSRSYDMNSDALFCNDRNSADYTFHELVVMSPFLTGSVIEQLNKDDRGLTDCWRTLITRRSELSKMKKYQADNFNIYVLKDEIVDGEDYISDQNDDRSKQDIHAKIYLRRKYADVDLYFGSMNASYSGINTNVEMMIKLHTKNRYLNADSFLNDIFCGSKDGTDNPFEPVSVMEELQDAESGYEDILELKIKELCRVKKRAVIVDGQDNQYSVQIEFEGWEKDENVLISPFHSNQKKIIDYHVQFDNLELLQLSEFYEVIASTGNTSVHRIIMIPTTGFPSDRESAVVNSVVKDRGSFVEYIAFVLGDDYLLSLLEEKQLRESGLLKQSRNAMPALYEKMLKTSLEAPERLRDIGYVMKMITDKEIIPDEFRETYEVFCKILKIKQR